MGVARKKKKYKNVSVKLNPKRFQAAQALRPYEMSAPIPDKDSWFTKAKKWTIENWKPIAAASAIAVGGYFLKKKVGGWTGKLEERNNITNDLNNVLESEEYDKYTDSSGVVHSKIRVPYFKSVPTSEGEQGFESSQIQQNKATPIPTKPKNFNRYVTYVNPLRDLMKIETKRKSAFEVFTEYSYDDIVNSGKTGTGIMIQAKGSDKMDIVKRIPSFVRSVFNEIKNLLGFGYEAVKNYAERIKLMLAERRKKMDYDEDSSAFDFKFDARLKLALEVAMEIYGIPGFEIINALF